jgi:ABC-2 type transport system ATP-binding protein
MAIGATLSALGLNKRYRKRGRLVLHDVNLEIRPGGLTALVGPNGAGKSTLIRCWMGFERPTSGSALVTGIDPWRRRDAALSIVGYVPQGSAFYRALTVGEHLDLARILRRGFDSALVRRRLASLGIPLEQRAIELSGGQQAQVSLAIALGTRAPILILDEPLASLDPLARREFMQVLLEIVRRGDSSAVLSSHVVTDIEQACNRVVILSDGQVQLDLEVSEVLATHRVAAESDSVSNGVLIARFPSVTGQTLGLVRGGPNESLQHATLEDVVMGYLAADRVKADVATSSQLLDGI